MRKRGKELGKGCVKKRKKTNWEEKKCEIKNIKKEDKMWKENECKKNTEKGEVDKKEKEKC